MAVLTTTVTPAIIAVAVGVPAPSSGSPTEAQWAMWIEDALGLIQHRVDSIEPAPEVNQADLDYVIRCAVQVRSERAVGGAAQVTTSADDTQVSRTYRKSGGVEVEITDEWWARLGLVESSGGAFTVDLISEGWA